MLTHFVGAHAAGHGEPTMSIISVSAAPRTQGLAAYGSSVPGEFRFVTNNRSDFFPLHGHEKRCTLESSLLFPVSPHFVSVNSSLPLSSRLAQGIWPTAGSRFTTLEARSQVPSMPCQKGQTKLSRIHAYGLVSSSSTTSESVWPRIIPSFVPSSDQCISAMRSDLKFVICFPGEPSSGCSQRLSASPSRKA